MAPTSLLTTRSLIKLMIRAHVDSPSSSSECINLIGLPFFSNPRANSKLLTYLAAVSRFEDSIGDVQQLFTAMISTREPKQAECKHGGPWTFRAHRLT